MTGVQTCALPISTGKIELGGRLVTWIIEDGAYTPDGGSSTKYFPNGYICAIAGDGASDGIGMSPIHVEVSRAERPHRLDGTTDLSPFSWVPEGGDSVEKNCQESMIVTSREMAMVGDPKRLGSLYVLT